MHPEMMNGVPRGWTPTIPLVDAVYSGFWGGGGGGGGGGNTGSASIIGAFDYQFGMTCSFGVEKNSP